jgi:hypothetical protein
MHGESHITRARSLVENPKRSLMDDIGFQERLDKGGPLE